MCVFVGGWLCVSTHIPSMPRQMAEERQWRSCDAKSSMHMDGRTLKSQLEEAELQRLASR